MNFYDIFQILYHESKMVKVKLQKQSELVGNQINIIINNYQGTRNK
ncbi:unnamed protein product [Paramecium octaurelia]|uniref:Uncharacterized protein n=1 Tax=Paramecium octaurelia TaxID=43137 RepID=A0A8S1Y4J6_PAROT|nr:unnamed protein product [Paramecium octaurelia]